MKVRTLIGGGLAFFCPGCKEVHAINSHPKGPRWNYNGDAASPTFQPSILVTWGWNAERRVCHSFVTEGHIQFLGDSTHKLAGQTVAVPEWPYGPGRYGGVDETV